MHIKYIFITLAFTCTLQVCAQNSSEFPTTERITLTAKNFKDVSDKITAYISKEGERTISLYKTETTLTANFILSQQKMKSLDSLAYKLGKVTQLNVNSNDLDRKKADMQRYIDNTKASIKQTEDQLERLIKEQESQKNDPIIEERITGSGSNRSKTYGSQSSEKTLQNHLANYQRNLTNYENTLENYNKYENYVYVTLSLADEKKTRNTYSTSNSRNRKKTSNVNMPGIEYGFLWIENPKPGYSTKAYESFAAKYNLKKNKGTFTLGIFKNADDQSTDSSAIGEMMFFNYGQQLYSQHWQRGNRAFLNPYIGYQAGLFFTNQADNGLNTIKPNVNMALGLEIYKNNFILIDNKLSYFVPIDTRNRDLRGLLYNVSFNFVF